MGVERWIARWRDEVGDAYAAGLVRVLIGLFLFRQALQEIEHVAKVGELGEHFYLPMLPESLLRSPLAHRFCLAAQLVLAMLIVVGWMARPALAAAASIGLYLQACDRLRYHHHNYALFLFATLLAFAPCDRSFVRGQRILPAEQRQGPLWAMRLAQLQLSIIYVASSGSKLLDRDWRSGLVLLDRLRRYTAVALAHGVPRPLLATVASPLGASVLAKLAIATELAIAVGAWGRRSRPVALWLGVWFHLAIHLTTVVDIFSALSVTILLLFATPDVQGRVLLVGTSSRWQCAARLVRSLDWLERLRVEQPQGASGLSVVDRSGRLATGFSAGVLLARCLPVLFPFWLPLRVLELARTVLPSRQRRG